MPKGKLTEEQKEAAFEAWKGTEEYTAAQKFVATRETIPKLEIALKDVPFPMLRQQSVPETEDLVMLVLT